MYKYEFKIQDAIDFAFSRGIKTRKKGKQLQFDICPYCRGGMKSDKDKETFAINIDDGRFNCKRASCAVSGNMITLSKDFDFSLGAEVDEYYKPKKRFKTFKNVKPEPKPAAITYMESRGISEEITKQYNITTQKEKENILVFPFYDEKDTLQFIKYRKTDFDKEKDKSKEWCETGGKPILFGMNKCVPEENKTLIIAEGQCDSLAITECGIQNAVSVPTGANGFTWVPYCWDFMEKFDTLIVFGDYEHGKITLLEEMKRRFNGSVKHVREKDYKGCKDANEILLKHGKQAVRDAVENAVPIPVKHVIEVADVEDVDIYKIKKISTTIKEVDRVLNGGIPFGGTTLISAYRGTGKSTWASQIAANALNDGHNVFAYSGELANYLFKSWVNFQIAGRNHIIENESIAGNVYRIISNSNLERISDWYRGKFFLYDSDSIDGDETENLPNTIEKAIKQNNCDVILIDNLMTAIDLDGESVTNDVYDRQSRFVKKLTRIAKRYDVAMILVVHKRKNSFSDDENNEISGSGDITNLASVTMSYGKSNEISAEQRIIKVVKNRLFGKVNLDGIVTAYDEKSKRIFSTQEEVMRKYGWEDGLDDGPEEVKAAGFEKADEEEIVFD